MTPLINAGAVVMDANVFIALSAREKAKLAVAEAALSAYAAKGWLFYAPGVIIAEALYVLCGYSCRRSADGIYIALAEELAQTRTTELLTFDTDLPKQAARNAPTVKVNLLPC